MTPSSRRPLREPASVTIDPGTVAAAVLDADGVLTDSRVLRAAAWQDTLDSYAAQYARATGRPQQALSVPAELRTELTALLDRDAAAELLRAHGYRSDLACRHLGPSGTDLLDLLVGHADQRFVELLRTEGVKARTGAAVLLLDLRAAGIRTAAVSTGRHCAELLRNAGLAHLMDGMVDATDAEHHHLAGPPEPALHQLALKLLHSTPGRAVLLTDNQETVTAGHRAGFGSVITVTRHGVGTGAPRNGPAVQDLEGVFVRPHVR